MELSVFKSGNDIFNFDEINVTNYTFSRTSELSPYIDQIHIKRSRKGQTNSFRFCSPNTISLRFNFVKYFL